MQIYLYNIDICSILLSLWIVTLLSHRADSAITQQYQLIFQTDSTTYQSGSVTLECRNSITLEEINVQQVKFWLNATSSNAQDLREREDFAGGIEVIGCCSIKFNLTRNLEGFYTCGEISDDGALIESPSLELISLQTFIPQTVSIQTNFSATSGDTAIIQCPIKPGALLQHYYVAWYKDDILIAELDNLVHTDSRYDINMSTFSLIINSSNINDTSTNYQCEVYVQNPLSDTNTKINTEIDDKLTLQVYEKPTTISETSSFNSTNSTEQSSVHPVVKRSPLASGDVFPAMIDVGEATPRSVSHVTARWRGIFAGIMLLSVFAVVLAVSVGAVWYHRQWKKKHVQYFHLEFTSP